MNIKAITPNLSKVDQYNLLSCPEVSRMNLLDGQEVNVLAFAVVEDTDIKTGELKTVVRIKTMSGVYATNSNSFARCFSDILAVFEPSEVQKIAVTHGRSNSGREYLLCRYCE